MNIFIGEFKLTNSDADFDYETYLSSRNSNIN